MWAGLPTPWKEDWSLDEQSLVTNIQRMIKARVQGIYLLGSTGEFYALNFDEFKATVDILVGEASASGIPLAVVCASPSTRETIRLLEYAALREIDAAQLVLPYWMEMTEREMMNFFRDVASAVPDLPIIHYNIPRAKRFLLGPDYSKIRQVLPNLVASKFTFAGSHFGDLCEAAILNPEMKFFVGESLLVSAMQIGAHGSSSSLVYTNSAYLLKMYELARTGHWQEALAIQKQVQLFTGGLIAILSDLGEGYIDPVVDKGLGVASGGIVGHQRTRAPYIGWSDATVSTVRKWIADHFPEFLAE
jgi:dihydrodipicolinate synthase/N-acetylneuraminate lyase